MLAVVAEELYLRLFRELNDSRFDSRETSEVLARLGAPAVAFRAYAHARRRTWGSAKADFRAALGDYGEVPALIAWVCGAGLFVARDYDRALAALAHAAETAPANDQIGIATRARKLALKFATALGWSQEARELREAIATHDIQRAKHLRAHSLELKRQAAIRRRAQQALEGSPEAAARKAYSLVFRDGPAAAREALDTLVRRYPEHPAALAARLRLDLLLDELEAAEQRVRNLPEALADQLRAERAALALAWGDGATTLELTQGCDDDPRQLYLRGLAVRLVFDDFEEASSLLEQARVLLPNSVAINLAQAVIRYQHAPKRFDEDMERRFDQLLADAPGLLADAAQSVGITLWQDRGPVSEREDMAKILLRAQGMLTAEHDLEIASYARRGADGRLHLRHVAPAPSSPGGDSHLAKLERDEDEIISQYEAILVWSIGVQPPRPSGPGEVAVVEQEPERTWTPRYLSQAQIQQFLDDGFAVVRGAFDPELARRWREEGTRRLREEPEKWVRGYDPEDPTRSLANFQPDDPETWTWSRVDLTGPETLVIEEFAPDAWAAICDLLGGPGRIKTRTWGHYLILNLRDDDPLARDRPGPHAPSWHIDDPSPATRIDNIRNGLVCIALFSKLLPRSGNTWLALDSVPRVARELAAHPEGVDFLNERGSHITGQCERFFEVVGEPGDILMMHPLMMHSASRNRSGRIRWMANPMVYLKEPLDPFRPVEEMSPVELAIHRAISE
jgi:hypothetical protein